MGDRSTSESERPARLLDDEADRGELRDRYYGLLQELRVVLPGVQVLLAFLLTAPFAQRFKSLGATDRAVFGAALVCSMLSVISFVSPIAFHRFGPRTARALRLELSIVATRAGLLFLALAIVLSFTVVSSLLFDSFVAAALIAVTAAAMLGAWLVLPLVLRSEEHQNG